MIFIKSFNGQLYDMIIFLIKTIERKKNVKTYYEHKRNGIVNTSKKKKWYCQKNKK